MFVFCTDGFIGNDAEILKAVKEERGSARFFGFGIGSSVNRYLMEGIGEQGGGATHIVLPRDSESVATGVERLFAAIDSPVLVNVAMDWNGLPVDDVYPSKLGDLFAGQTINVIGRFTRAAKGTAFVTGRIGARHVRFPVRVDLPESEPLHAALAPVWARARIADLSTAMLVADSSTARHLAADITALAVEHHLVSQYTSFVAVDESRVVGNGMPMRIVQPVELPEGVSYKGIFGEEVEGRPVRIGAWQLHPCRTRRLASSVWATSSRAVTRSAPAFGGARRSPRSTARRSRVSRSSRPRSSRRAATFGSAGRSASSSSSKRPDCHEAPRSL